MTNPNNIPAQEADIRAAAYAKAFRRYEATGSPMARVELAAAAARLAEHGQAIPAPEQA